MAESCAALGRAVISQVHFLTSSAELAREEAGKKKKCGQGVLDAPHGVIGASCMANTLHSAQKYLLNGGSFFHLQALQVVQYTFYMQPVQNPNKTR